MMKSEFDALLGHEVSQETYNVIEECYMYFDNLFPTKAAVVSYYKKHDLNFFEQLRKDIYAIEREKDKIKNENEKLKEEIKRYEEIMKNIRSIVS